jgi:mRNA-degrading endonuclease RelE of RelBE toxin-antitoxin system
VPEIVWSRNARDYLLELGTSSRERLLEQIAHLRRFPRLGVGLEGPYDGKRRLTIGRFMVVYEIDDNADQVRIVAIGYGGPARP